MPLPEELALAVIDMVADTSGRAAANAMTGKTRRRRPIWISNALRLRGGHILEQYAVTVDVLEAWRFEVH
jgi:hypothetical protein